MRRHSENCNDFCISGDQLKAGLEAMGLWFDGRVLSVKLGSKRHDPETGKALEPVMSGHRSSWYAEVEVGGRGDGSYEIRLIRIPVHPGPPEFVHPYDPMGSTCKVTWAIAHVEGRTFTRCVLNPGHFGHHTDVAPEGDTP